MAGEELEVLHPVVDVGVLVAALDQGGHTSMVSAGLRLPGCPVFSNLCIQIGSEKPVPHEVL